MAAAVVDGLGLVGSVLGIVGFIQDNIPEKPAEGASIRIKAGNPGDDNPGLDGDVSAAYAWDTNNNYLGQADGDHVEVGDVADLTIDSFSPGSRAEYVGVSVGDNAVCIAWVTVSMYDGTDGGSWTGDIGYQCGQNWYEQDEMAGYLDEEQKQEYIPRCTWLDADHTFDVPSAAMKFSSTAYGKEVKDTADNSKGCDFTLWGADDGPINDKPQKRSGRARLPWMEERLVVSTISRHKAENLCSSETSWGPDFVGTDGMFCDMDTKTLIPLCSTKKVQGCIDIDDEKKVATKRFVTTKRDVSTTHKEYKTIKHWG
ncbi:hypothetical protein QQZ08_007582 [Neonectria magnoliae]|uniref:Uncharacterized protein n=1 Tax=Neonectria magnoliae TaxID=2732573 RepID=A0ABR1HZ15_9HYPO